MSYILFHSAGTAGDYITCLLTRTGKYYSRCDYEDIDETGKCHPKAIKPEVHKHFPDPNIRHRRWGARDWNDFDESKLKSLTDKIWILNSMRYRQIGQLRNKGCTWPIIRIKYSHNLDHWIKKALLKKLYRKGFWMNEPRDPMESKLKDKGVWNLFYFKKHLKDPIGCPLLTEHHQEHVWTKYPCDIEIDLEKILAKDFSQMKELVDLDSIDQKLVDIWTNAQDQKFVTRPKMPQEVETILGYNEHLDPSDTVCEVDDFDNLLIQHHYPDAPKFSNTQELFTYF